MRENGYTKETRWLKLPGRKIRLLIYRPAKNNKPKDKTPGILWIHGGGYILGFPEMVQMTRALPLVEKYGAVVISPDYRLASKTPYPAAVQDCYASLLYLKNHAAELGINSSQIMVGGESAGGGLAAAVCMAARDTGQVQVAFQMPLYPMLDDRDTESSADNHAPVWNTRRNHYGWKCYLRESWKSSQVSAYAAPARQPDYRNLPPAYTFVGDIEPFYCETLEYAENLKKAGVPVKVDIYHGWFHGYDIVLPFRKKSRTAAENFEKAYEYAVEHYFAEQKASCEESK